MGSRVSIILSKRDDKSRKTIEEVLRLLGWRMQISKKVVRLEASEESSAAGRRLTSTSLNIDELAMQEALQSDRPFAIEIVDDLFPVMFGQDLWRSQFFAGKQLAGGFAEALALNPVLAKVYVGLAALDGESALVLLREIGLKKLGEKYADLLYRYATALAVIGKRVMFPGGDKAAPIWVQLADAKSNAPGEFFRSLLNKDDGKLLAFYFNIAQLDTQHQAFFTQSPGRTRQYYEMFKNSPDLQFGPNRLQRTAPFAEFIRGVPLDAGSRVRFPGSPGVWMVAKGASEDVAGTATLLRKVAKTAAPEREDEILIRLMGIGYGASQQPQSELDNFLAVTSVDSHRKEPLDERSALMLAQQFAHYYPAWPYFAVLTGLRADEFERFFAMGSKVRDLDAVLLNDLMGQCHALIELLCRLQQSGKLDVQQSTMLFGTICDRFAQANGAAELTTASLEITREILKQALKEAPANPDEAMEALLLDTPIAPNLEPGEKGRRLEAAQSRHENYRNVLELQKVTPLHALFSIQDATRNLNRDLADSEKQVKLIEESSRGLLTVEIPESIKLTGAMKDNLLSFRPKDIEELIARLRRILAKKDANPQEIHKLTEQLLAAINPQVKIALAGIVYACYLNPDDLPVSADPLLLRKHQFVRLRDEGKSPAPFYKAEILSDKSAGSCFLGGFADFGEIAGRVAFTNARHEDDRIAPYFVSQIGSIRASRWEDLQDEDLRLVGLKIRCAREWIVQAAERPQFLMDLADGVSGLLSFARRAELLLALQSRDWNSVWDAVTLGDLYQLGDEYLHRYSADPWSSPVTVALRRLAAANDGSRLQILGSDLQSILYCSHPHLARLSPYEYYERYLLLDKIAARTSEFKIFLAEYFDRAGMPASLLGTLAEPLAREIFRSMQLADLRDWSSVISAYSRLNDELIKKVNREHQ